MADVTPDTLIDSRYRIASRVGSGGMGDVYCAQDVQLGRNVALKLLHRRFALDAEFVERFRREASSAAGLQHPNVVSVYDRGSWDGTYYIAMEYLEGRSLKALVREHAPLAPVRAIDLAAQVLRAARFAHRRGIIHRDLKPHNVIVDDEDRAKVTDFGIARAGASDMTETGSILGTAQYLSPEQAQGHVVTAASDLYAIGVILYELLTGRVPFDGDAAVTIALKHVTEAPVPPSVYSPVVSPALEAIVLRALEKDPARRFADADEFLAALAAARGGAAAGGPATASFAPALPAPTPAPAEVNGGAPPPTEHDPERRRRRVWPWLVALLVLALIGAGVAAYLLTRPPQVLVPDEVGKDFSAASTVLQSRGFSVTEIMQSSPDRPQGIVIRETPQPGASADKGATITLTVSSGPRLTPVPNLEGLGLRAAQRALRKAGFKRRVIRQSSSTVATGVVVKSQPSADQQVPQGSRVTLYVSSGPPMVAVPPVVGQTEPSATMELQNAGFQVQVVHAESTSAAPGTVIAEDPAANTLTISGQTVTITVARAPATVKVPGVVGQRQNDATNNLSSAGLTPQVVSRDVKARKQDGQVISQDPNPGQTVAKGSRVTIVVGRFQPPPTPPGKTGPTPTTPTTPTTTGPGGPPGKGKGRRK